MHSKSKSDVDEGVEVETYNSCRLKKIYFSGEKEEFYDHDLTRFFENKHRVTIDYI
jgi:hypothetical protein